VEGRTDPSSGGTFNFIRDFAPFAGVFRVPNLMEVNPMVPANTVPEFIAYEGQH
jgi:hypothetical protein